MFQRPKEKSVFDFLQFITFDWKNIFSRSKLYLLPLSLSYLPVSASSLLPFYLTAFLVLITNKNTLGRKFAGIRPHGKHSVVGKIILKWILMN